MASCRVSSKERLAPHHETRGTALQPGVLDIVDRAGLIEPFLNAGVHIKHSQLMGPGMRPIMNADFGGVGCRYEFQCSQPQWQTEQILRDHLAARGVKVEYGAEVTAIEPGPETLGVTLDVGGRTEAARPHYLLGAGGAHGITRHSMNEHLVGETYGGRYVVADVKLGLAIPPETARVVVGAGRLRPVRAAAGQSLAHFCQPRPGRCARRSADRRRARRDRQRAGRRRRRLERFALGLLFQDASARS